MATIAAFESNNTMAKAILEKNSKEAHESKTSISRHVARVPWNQIEELLNLAQNSSPEKFPFPGAVLEAVGYSKTNYIDWKASGEAPLRFKWALKGLLSELNIHAPAPKLFDFVELSLLQIAVCEKMLDSPGDTIEGHQYETLTKRLASLIASYEA